MPSAETPSEAVRLESLWSGEFGDAYVARNAHAGASRHTFWHPLLDDFSCASVLEVGCNVGANLQHLVGSGRDVWGVDVNRASLRELHVRLPDVSSGWAVARDLPFRDARFDLVFTVAVLIHQPENALPRAMAEMVRCSRRWVLAVEYVSDETVVVNYRGEPAAFFKRDYGRLFGELFPQLRLVRKGQLTKAGGFDDGLGFWLYEHRVGRSTEVLESPAAG